MICCSIQGTWKTVQIEPADQGQLADDAHGFEVAGGDAPEAAPDVDAPADEAKPRKSGLFGRLFGKKK